MDPTQLQELGLTEDQITQLMQLGVLEGEGDIIGQELEMANTLRGTPGPQGRMTGRAYTAANPLEFLGTGIDQIRGSYQQQQGLKQQRANAQTQAGLRQQYLGALLKGQRGSQAPASPGGMSPSPTTAAQMFPMPGSAR